jgi:hypothetical protein
LALSGLYKDDVKRGDLDQTVTLPPEAQEGAINVRVGRLKTYVHVPVNAQPMKRDRLRQLWINRDNEGSSTDEDEAEQGSLEDAGLAEATKDLQQGRRTSHKAASVSISTRNKHQHDLDIATATATATATVPPRQMRINTMTAGQNDGAVIDTRAIVPLPVERLERKKKKAQQQQQQQQQASASASAHVVPGLDVYFDEEPVTQPQKKTKGPYAKRGRKRGITLQVEPVVYRDVEFQTVDQPVPGGKGNANKSKDWMQLETTRIEHGMPRQILTRRASK